MWGIRYARGEREGYEKAYKRKERGQPWYLFTFPPPLLLNIPLKNFSPTATTVCSRHFIILWITTWDHDRIWYVGRIIWWYRCPRIHPLTGAHTQNVENNWKNAKMRNINVIMVCTVKWWTVICVSPHQNKKYNLVNFPPITHSSKTLTLLFYIKWAKYSQCTWRIP